MADKQYPTETVQLNRDGKTVRIPYDPKTGLVPVEALKEHARKTGAVIDYDKEADVLLPQELTPRQAAAWWAHPEDYDIEGIDMPGKPRRDTSDYKGRAKKIQDKIGVYGTPLEEKWIRKNLSEDFTEDELAKMAKRGMSVYCRPLPQDVTGRASGAMIQIDRYRAMKEDGTLAHEGSHVVRLMDADRQKRTSSSVDRWSSYKDDWRSVEESCTVAEELVRMRMPWSKEKAVSGYYSKVPVWDKEKKRWRAPTADEQIRMAAEDKAILRGKEGKPLRGRAASKAIEERWQDTNISRLRLHRRMAISTLMEAAPEEFHSDPRGLKKPAKPPAKSPAKTAGKKPATKKVRTKTGQQGGSRILSGTGRTAVPADRRKASERRK